MVVHVVMAHALIVQAHVTQVFLSHFSLAPSHFTHFTLAFQGGGANLAELTMSDHPLISGLSEEAVSTAATHVSAVAGAAETMSTETVSSALRP